MGTHLNAPTIPVEYAITSARRLRFTVPALHAKNAQFLKNRDSIHDWRNVILHRGVPLAEIWPEELCKMIPEIAMQFVRDCWEVFRTLNNRLICTTG